MEGEIALIERLQLHTQASNLHTCGLSQGLVSALFDSWAARHGGDAVVGFEIHMSKVAQFYQERCAFFLAAAERHLTGLAEWTAPTAGMFVWLRLHGVLETHALTSEHAVTAKVLLVPGSSFDPAGAPSSYVRAAYSTASPEQMDAALDRLARLLERERTATSR